LKKPWKKRNNQLFFLFVNQGPVPGKDQGLPFYIGGGLPSAPPPARTSLRALPAHTKTLPQLRMTGLLAGTRAVNVFVTLSLWNAAFGGRKQ